MKYIFLICFIGLGLMPVLAQARIGDGKSDREIAEILIKQSIAQYDGPCSCPYSVNRGGRRCGTSSAYVKPNGESPLCFPKDVTAEMIRRFRAL